MLVKEPQPRKYEQSSMGFLKYLPLFLVAVHACVCVSVQMYLWASACPWRPEINLWFLPQLFIILFFFFFKLMSFIYSGNSLINQTA